MSVNLKTGLGCCGPYIVEHGAESQQRLALPILADFRKESVLNRVPFRSARRIVAKGDSYLMRLAELAMQAPLENAGSGRIGPAAVSQDQQFRGLGEIQGALMTPPICDRVDGQGWCFGCGSHADQAAIVLAIVNAIGNGDSAGIGTEVVVQHRQGLLLPGAPCVSEIADGFFLFRIDADDRVAGVLERISHVGDMLELTIALLWRRRMPEAGFDPLVIDPQRIVHLVQESAYRFGADTNAVVSQFGGNTSSRFAGPSQTAHRVASGLLFYEGLDSSEDFWRFFPAACARHRPGGFVHWKLPRSTVPGGPCRPYGDRFPVAQRFADRHHVRV